MDYITKADAIKTTWMILEGLGYRKSDNVELQKTVSDVFDTCPSKETT